MASLREIRQKIKSIKSVTQVTHTMKLVSSVKFAKAQSAVVNARPFAQGIGGLVRDIAYDCNHPFFANRDSRSIPPRGGIWESSPALLDCSFGDCPAKRGKGKMGILLVTADRGLCGSFNNNLTRKCLDFVSQNPDREFVFYAAGRKGRDFLVRQGIKLRNEYTGIFRNLNYSTAEIIADELISAFVSGDVSSVWVVYSEFISAGRQRDTAVRLLPVERKEHEKTAHEVERLYEPARDILLDGLLKRYFRAKIFGVLLESNASEQYARMVAMDMATKNANEIIDDLTLEMNKLRQMNITKELSEIVGTAEALMK